MVTTHEPKKKRSRRTPEQIIADLEEKIARTKARAAAKEAKATPDGQGLISAIRALDRAARVATEEGNDSAVTALDSARAILAPALIEMGLRVPVPRGPRKGSRAA